MSYNCGIDPSSPIWKLRSAFNHLFLVLDLTLCRFIPPTRLVRYVDEGDDDAEIQGAEERLKDGWAVDGAV